MSYQRLPVPEPHAKRQKLDTPQPQCRSTQEPEDAAGFQDLHMPNHPFVAQQAINRIIAPEPKEYGNTTVSFLSSLQQHASTPSILAMKITVRAKEFLNVGTLLALQKGAYTWLNDAFLEISVSTMMDNDSLLGIVMAMTA